MILEALPSADASVVKRWRRLGRVVVLGSFDIFVGASAIGDEVLVVSITVEVPSAVDMCSGEMLFTVAPTSDVSIICGLLYSEIEA